MSRRIVITGLGVISPLGLSLQETWNGLCSGRRAITPMTAETFPARQAGQVLDFNPRSFGIKPKALKVMNRTIQLAIAAARSALDDAAWTGDEPPEQTGLSFGVDGLQYTAEEMLIASYEAAGSDMAAYIDDPAHPPVHTADPSLAVHPLWPLSVLANMSLCHLSIQFNIQGPNLAFSSLDNGGAVAVGEAFRSIQQGEADCYLAGGSYGLNTMQALSLRTQQVLALDGVGTPFDPASSGMVMGEGAAVLLLEEREHARRRGARIYAEISGYASGYDPADPVAAMAAYLGDSLDSAGRRPAQVDAIYVDGHAIAAVDQAEAAALRQVMGSSLADTRITGATPLTGHLLPAAGALGAALAAHSIATGCVPPYSVPRRALPADMPFAEKLLKKDIGCVISSTFGLSGEHAALTLTASH